MLTLLLVVTPLAILSGTASTAATVLNGRVGSTLGSLAATRKFLTFGALLALPLALVSGEVGWPSRLLEFPWYLWLPGAVNIALIANLIFIVNRLGALLTTCSVYLGQLLASALIDTVGLLGVEPVPIQAVRLVATVLLAIGTGVALSGPAQAGVPVRPNVTAVVLALAQGAALACATAMNADLAARIGAFGSALMFLAPGALALWLVLPWTRRGAVPGPRAPCSSLGVMTVAMPGALNVVGIVGAILLVPMIGLQPTVAATLVAGLVAGMVIDQTGLLGAPRLPVSLRRLAGGAMAVAAVTVLLMTS